MVLDWHDITGIGRREGLLYYSRVLRFGISNCLDHFQGKLCSLGTAYHVDYE